FQHPLRGSAARLGFALVFPAAHFSMAHHFTGTDQRLFSQSLICLPNRSSPLTSWFYLRPFRPWRYILFTVSDGSVRRPAMITFSGVKNARSFIPTILTSIDHAVLNAGG